MGVWWWFSLLVKLALTTWVPQTADENYYWVWSQNLSLSYYDHPPMVAWLFKLGSFLPDLMLKWPAVLVGHLALWVWALFLRNIGFREDQIRIWFLVAVMAPLVGMSSMVLTPDLPLLFFFSLATYAFERALNTGALAHYLLFGISLGLGFTSKYLIVLLLPCLFVYLAVSGQWQRVRWGWVPAVIVFAILGALPVLVWNYQHEWISFRFQLHHGVGKKSWRPIWPLEYLLSVLFLLFPIYWSEFWKAIKLRQQKLLLCLSVPIFLFFLMTSFRSKVEANWTQVAFLPALSLVAYYDRSIWKARVTFGFWALALLVLVGFWQRPWFPGCPEKVCEPRRYQSVLEVAEQYQPFMASNYQMASYLWFKTKKPVYKLFDMSRTDYFDTFVSAKPLANTFYLAKHAETELPHWLQKEGYRVREIKAIDEELLLLEVSR